MKIVATIQELKTILASLRQRKQRIGFVPTMGALHEGHLSLIRAARAECDAVVASIFVNPLQFGPGEDFIRYPRPRARDYALCRKEGVTVVFTPHQRQIYPRGFATAVSVPRLQDVLCGRSRPGHFQGVATVVTKLLHVVAPNVLYVGQKDAQQAAIIRRLIKDLNIPVTLRVMPVVREADGLARSSRNAYLSAGERRDAAVIFEALTLARTLLFKENVRDSTLIVRRMRGLLRRKKGARIEYVSVVNAETLESVRRVEGRCLVAVAAWFGKTRLIDNIRVTVG